ncbi:AhpC/TSA family protein [Spirosoma sp. BT702]|uniref:AhpC/TSA family protein n=2 Tax=Spirosoma profusum TaxID=2771354 RepID=A0A926XWF3_9BACT|nr:AhpC/TSA family protein [Spirosoma profusum]
MLSTIVKRVKNDWALAFQLAALLCISYSLAGAQVKPKESYTLNGQWDEPQRRKVHLLNLNNEVVDSAQVVGTQFVFKGKLAEPNLYFIRVDAAARRYPVFLEHSAMRVRFSKDGTYQLTGSKLHQQWQAYNSMFVDPIREQLIRLYTQRSDALKQGDSLRFNQLMKQNDSLSIYFGTHQKDYIAQKPYTLFNLFLLTESGMSDDYIANMLTEFKSELGNTPTFKRLEEALQKKTQQRAKIVTGTQAYAFSLPDSTGKLHRLATVGKKVTLLNFWASWCGPCIAQFPVLKELEAKYSRQRLAVIGISIDDDRQRWLQALRKLNPPGLQLSARKDQVLKDNYAIYSIPQVYLLDEAGKIIGINLEADALNKKLAELLSTKP